MRARTALACIAAFACVGLTSACSSIPKATAMRPQDASFPTQLPVGIVVKVSGGQDFSFRISNGEFEQALRDSLFDSGLLPRIVEGDPEYRLDVVLGDGHGIEGRELIVLWSLSRADTQQTFWQKLITSRGRSHHFVGVTRQRRGLEYAAQENIRLGLEQLSGVDWTAVAGLTAEFGAEGATR